VKRFVYLFLVFSLFSFGQKEIDHIKVELLSIKRFDSVPNYSCFIINYSIENVSQKDVSFFLDISKIFPTFQSSVSIMPNYEFFQNEKNLNISLFENDKRMIGVENEYFMGKNMGYKRIPADSLEVKEYYKYATDEEYRLKKDTERYFNAIKRLKPNEKLEVSIPLYWDKKRYYKEDELEYYLNETDNYELKINIILWKEELKNKFLPEKYELIQNDATFIKGWYSSNKLPINLK